jgi:hypothetical protein
MLEDRRLFKTIRRAALALLAASSVYAQQRSLREMVAVEGDLHRFIRVSVPPTSLRELLGETDVVVRGIVGSNPVAYLSDDGTDVLTDYTIQNPQIIALVNRGTTTKAAGAIGPLTVTQFGGTVTVDGHQVSVDHVALPPLKAGTEAVFLLVRSGEKYRIVGKYLGVFAIENGAVATLSLVGGVGVEQRGKALNSFVSELKDTIRGLGR